jgi:drug/metabolite transporter (DMT)-like permease
MRTETLAKLACAYSGLVWGLFWIPLRTLDQQGIEGLWAAFVFYIAPVLLTLPLMVWRWRKIVEGGVSLQVTGLAAALGLVFYSIAVLNTEVVRAMLLYYLTPVWSTILARIMLGEAITPVRWLAMAVALLGMLIIFGIDVGLPLPRNLGDWLALASGVVWAWAAVRLRTEKNSAIEITHVNFLWSLLIASVFLLIWREGPAPDWSSAIPALPWWMILMLLAIITGPFTSLWGAKHLNPGLVGLLFMTEISVGAATAALWAGEPFGWREIVGIVLITSAGALESVWDLWRERRARAVQVA